MEGVETTPSGKLMLAIFGEKALNLYSYILEDGDGYKRQVILEEAVKEALETLPQEAWQRAIDFRFGLSDGISRPRQAVGKELNNVTRERIRQIEMKSLRLLRHPSRSRRLRLFIVPSPKEMNDILKERKRLREENRALGESNKKLKTILRAWGVKEEELEGVGLEWLLSEKRLLEEKDKQEFEALALRFPNKPVWNSLRRAACWHPEMMRPANLKEILLTGEFQKLKNAGKIRNIGEKGIDFLKQVFRELEKEASS